MYNELVNSLRICGKTRSVDDYCVTFHDGCCEAEPLCMYELMMKAADAIEELADRNVGKWIPVTERLPRKNGFYLCLYKHKHPGGVAMDEGLSIQQWYNGRWNLNEIYTVTHWMPLPEPPKEEAK